MRSNYDKHPVIAITPEANLCLQGWPEVAGALGEIARSRKRFILVLETYPGINLQRLTAAVSQAVGAASVVLSEDAFLPTARLRETFSETLSDDPVFNMMHPWTIDAYFDPDKLAAARRSIDDASGIVVVAGTGASLLAGTPDLLISVNLSRWEIQQRQRQHRISNLGFKNAGAPPGELYKHAFFLDWRVADRARHAIYQHVDFFLDLNQDEQPKMVAGEVLRDAVTAAVRRPFRVVPFFDPGPWGGQWMRRQFDLPDGPPNYAWGFDCVPEENSVLLGFGERTFELPAIVLVHEEPELLLGATISGRFGAEFPIRFDLLDTVHGGNLSLQVHPSERYIREHFGMPYTQDESYYMLHSQPGALMYLGLKGETLRGAMSEALEKANRGDGSFAAEQFVTTWPTATHDHFSIPAGTVHCSGAGNVVLEISATPYIFTFKLWDWGRTGLDGRPRPIHLEHGLANICWDRTTQWVQRELVDQTEILGSGDGWREERTGLHRSQFLETRRHWFTKEVPHDTSGNLHVVNLVEGEEAVVYSPTGAFAPLQVHYAETLIVPASLGAYCIAPPDGQVAGQGKQLATLKAYVRP